MLLFIDNYADRLPGSTFTLLVASANYKPLMATVLSCMLTGTEVTEPSPLPYKTSTECQKQRLALSLPLLLQFRAGNYKFLGSIIHSLNSSVMTAEQ